MLYCMYLQTWNMRMKNSESPVFRTWGCSSAGRAPALQAGGQEFDPPHLHQRASEDENDDRRQTNMGL